MARLRPTPLPLGHEAVGCGGAVAAAKPSVIVSYGPLGTPKVATTSAIQISSVRAYNAFGTPRASTQSLQDAASVEAPFGRMPSEGPRISRVSTYTGPAPIDETKPHMSGMRADAPSYMLLRADAPSYTALRADAPSFSMLRADAPTFTPVTPTQCLERPPGWTPVGSQATTTFFRAPSEPVAPATMSVISQSLSALTACASPTASGSRRAYPPGLGLTPMAARAGGTVNFFQPTVGGASPRDQNFIPGIPSVALASEKAIGRVCTDPFHPVQTGTQAVAACAADGVEKRPAALQTPSRQSLLEKTRSVNLDEIVLDREVLLFLRQMQAATDGSKRPSAEDLGFILPEPGFILVQEREASPTSPPHPGYGVIVAEGGAQNTSAASSVGAPLQAKRRQHAQQPQPAQQHQHLQQNHQPQQHQQTKFHHWPQQQRSKPIGA